MRARRIVLPLVAAAALAAPATASAAFVHVVAPGESLSSVASVDGLSVGQLAAANGLSPTAELISGSQLAIPPQSGSEPSQGEAAVATGEAAVATRGDGDEDSDDGVGAEEGQGGEPVAASSASRYVVQPGDTLTALAARAGTTVEALAAANGLNASAPLLIGTTLALAGGGGSMSSAASVSNASSSASAASSQPVGATAEGSSSAPPYPTSQSASPEEIASIAAANGVPASLANAIAYQESGFNNELVSSADARGVMQITPGTWSWIQEALAGPTPLAPASAHDNVRGGVLLLHSLLQATGGNQELAAAGYYQGLPSVLQNGMYPSTQQYVADVRALQQRFGGE
jgi:LysM repeat protein